MNKENKIVPKLRFPEFVNEGEWSIEPFSEVYSFYGTNSFTRDNLNYSDGDVKNIHYGDIHTKFRTHFDIQKETVPFVNSDISIEKIKEDSFCKEGDMIYADASEDLNDIGKSIEIINTNNEKILSGLHTLLARQKTNKLSIGFGGHLFKSPSIRIQIQKEAQGAKVLGISATRLSNTKVYYPENKEEQQKIASCLSSLDELIAAHTNKLEALKDHKKGLMQQLFPAEGETVPKLRFKEFEKDGEWVETTIGELSNVTAGGTPESTNEKYWNGDIPWMNSGELNQKRVFEVSNYITIEGLKNSSTKLIPTYCVLIGLAGQGKTRGTAAINYIELCTNQSIGAIYPNRDKFISEFLYYKIDTLYDQLRLLSAGDGGRGGLNLQIIKAIKILLPKKAEQQKIANFLSSIDDEIAAQTQKIEGLKEHKKGLMQGLFPVMSSSSS